MSGDIVELKAMMASSPATNATSKVDLNLNGNHSNHGEEDAEAEIQVGSTKAEKIRKGYVNFVHSSYTTHCRVCHCCIVLINLVWFLF